MIEYKTERVLPQYESNILQVNASFGWQLISSQEIYNESTEIAGVDVKSYGAFMQGFTGNDGKINVRTYKNVTNYVSMRFGRDTRMPDYDKICALENEFYSSISARQPKKPATLTAIGVIAMIIVIISIINAISSGISAELWEILVCIAVPVIFIPLIILKWRSYKKNTALYERMQDDAADALTAAQQLVNGISEDAPEEDF